MIATGGHCHTFNGGRDIPWSVEHWG